ncbi:hypothetical protein N7532_005817 [Penicillium argentinense]|uniref:Uncharacterized protein n=1 Tax=Penicillium argentinense TaxID=1131581 RepID=A0A9W9FET7_9EURO|nr:uncharacterized protein N7532_005817 [Penicillium argentinense]KAJ5098816.1 hypothetical protein N7532_005817 [Penicillium argentinense]
MRPAYLASITANPKPCLVDNYADAFVVGQQEERLELQLLPHEASGALSGVGETPSWHTHLGAVRTPGTGQRVVTIPVVAILAGHALARVLSDTPGASSWQAGGVIGARDGTANSTHLLHVRRPLAFGGLGWCRQQEKGAWKGEKERTPPVDPRFPIYTIGNPRRMETPLIYRGGQDCNGEDQYDE